MSIASHRAFLSASLTLMIVLVLALVVGWRWHFKVIENRSILLELAAKADALRKQQSPTSVNSVLVSPPGRSLPENPSLLLADARPARFDPKAPVVPDASMIETLPIANAGSVLAEAMLVIEKYTSTPNWQDRAMYVFEPDRVGKLMEDYYEIQHGVDPVMGALIDKSRYRIDGTEIVLITYRSARPDGKLEIALRKNSLGRLVIDWESFVGYSEKSLTDLMKTKSVKPVLVRAMVKLDDYFNYEFSNASELLSLKLSVPDSDGFINAYCKRDSIIGKWITEDLGDDPASSLVKGYTLWVAYPESAQSNRCLNLVQIAAGRWLIVPPKN